MEDQETAPEAEAEAVVSEETSEATENTKGQTDEDQPAEGEDGDKPDTEEKSPAKARRERRKAEMARLKQEAREASEKYNKAQVRLQKIEDAARSFQPPKESDFTDYNEYLMALAAHKTTAALDERQKREINEETETHKASMDALKKQAQQEAAENWQSQVAEAKARYADFDTVALDPRVPINDDMAGIIATSDVAADVAYWLGLHRQEAAKIAQMEPLEMARTLGQIEARVSLPKPKTQTEAPDPITPVRPRSGATKDPSKMSMEEYKAARKAGKI